MKIALCNEVLGDLSLEAQCELAARLGYDGLEIAPFTTVADYLVVCSGGSERQLGAIADAGVEGLKHDGLPIVGREGEPASHWVLIDAGAVIVHVFAPPEREYYALEKLWADAKTVVSVQ